MIVDSAITWGESDDPNCAYLYGVSNNTSIVQFSLNLNDQPLVSKYEVQNSGALAHLGATNELFYSSDGSTVSRVRVTESGLVASGSPIALGKFHQVMSLVTYKGRVYALVELLDNVDTAYEIRELLSDTQVYRARKNNSVYDLAIDQTNGRMYVSTRFGIVCTWITSDKESDYTINTNPPESDLDPSFIPADKSITGEKSTEDPFRVAAHNNVVYYTTSYNNLKKVHVDNPLIIHDNGVFSKAGYADIAWVTSAELRQSYPVQLHPVQLWVSKTQSLKDSTHLVQTLYPLLACPANCSGGSGTCDVFTGACACAPGHYGADCSGCQRPPAGGCYAGLKWPSCDPDESDGVVQCSDAVTADVSQACCLSPRVFADAPSNCPPGWRVDVHDAYCTSVSHVIGPNEVRYKCVRKC